MNSGAAVQLDVSSSVGLVAGTVLGMLVVVVRGTLIVHLHARNNETSGLNSDGVIDDWQLSSHFGVFIDLYQTVNVNFYKL